MMLLIAVIIFLCIILTESIPYNAVACKTATLCRQKFADNQGVLFDDAPIIVGDHPTKGCFTKNDRVFFGTGGSNEDEETTNLPGERKRLWCDKYTIGVYYYPWHSNNFHNGEGYMRRNLEPPQLPLLGEYDDTEAKVIEYHLKWSRYANVNLWVNSWWGPNYMEDRTLKNVILPHQDLPGTRIALLYETNARVKRGLKHNITDVFYQDVEYIANTYFDNPNYYRIDNRPVMFVYLTRVLHREGTLDMVTSQMRQAAMDNGGHDLYIIGDQVMSSAPSNGKTYEPFDLLDAVTNYDIFGNLGRPSGYALMSRLNNLAARNRQWREETQRHGDCSFIPAVSPGYNDRGVRYEQNHPALSRKLCETCEEGSLFRTSIQKSLDLTDSSANRLMMVTSWNEWHEDTQIEPTVSMGQTIQPMNMTCYGNLCSKALTYDGYETLYLDILKKETAIDRGKENEFIWPVITDSPSYTPTTSIPTYSPSRVNNGTNSNDGPL